MAPSAAGPAQHHRPRSSSFGAAAADLDMVAVVAAPPASGAGHQPHHHHHHRRAGAPLSAPSVAATNSAGGGSGATPQMAVGHHRRSSSTSSSAVPVPASAQGGNERKVQLLSRSLSGTRLNAGAPSFVPKGLQIAVASSLPGFGEGLGLSPPSVVQGPSSVIPVMIPPPAAKGTSGGTGVFVPAAAAVQEAAMESPPSVERDSAKDGTDGAEVSVVASEHGGENETGQGGGGGVAQAAKPVVTEELKAKVVKQVEFYFSDTNLPTDNYLMKFVKKDPEGFVPIPVVASFRKIKNLVKNHGVVAAALRSSAMLVVSEDGKKVRRAQPLPDVDLEEVQARTVVAENLPEEPSIESMEELFGRVGPVKMVRICSPEAANGANSTAAKHPKSDMIISKKLHALVEYESVEVAERAVAELTDERNWRSGLRVRMLVRRQTFQNKHSYQQAPHQRARKTGAEGEVAAEEEEGGWEKHGEKVQEKGGEEGHGAHHHGERGDEFTGGEGGDAGGKKGRGRGRGGRAGGGGRGRGLHYHTHSGTPPQSSQYVGSEMVGKPPPGPRMPDGTRGFATGRGKPAATNTSGNSVS